MLRDYQRAIVAHILEHPRCNVWAGMGTGKTVSVLTALDYLHNVHGEERPTLVLAPLRVASTTWPDEQRKWAHLSALPVQSVTGTVAQRSAALKRDAAVYVTNYDNLPWLRDHLGERWPFGTVIADESTRLKGFRVRQGGQRARAIGQVAHTRIGRWVNLSGTPAPNGLMDLWGQAWFLDAGQRLGRSFHSFVARWFAVRKAHPNAKWGETIVLPGAQAEIEKLLADLTITVRAADFLDLPPLIENVIRVDLPGTARRQYRELEREMFTMLGQHQLEALTAANLSLKCLQMANGAAYTDAAGNWTEVHDEKIRALESVVEESAGAPVLVAYHFKSDLARLQRAFPSGRVLDTHPGTVRDWNDGKIPLLFCHPASAGHGLNLQHGGNILVFFGLWWNLEEHEQIIERIGPTRQAQAGHNRPVFVHRIIASDTVDELVLARLKGKASVQQILLDAMKGKA